MNIQRFTAATSREALAKARQAFGDGTLILSNRPTENGVEVVATAEDALDMLDQGSSGSSGKGKSSFASRTAEPLNYKDVASQVEDDAAQLSMSTLSFQDYVRERMARRRSEAGQDQTPAPATREVTQERLPRAAPTPSHTQEIAALQAKTIPARKPTAPAAPAPLPKGIADELHAMKELIEDRFNTLNWLGQARQNPIQANLMLKLIRAGYSPTLSRTILERMPEGSDANEAVRWVVDVLERNLRTDANGLALHEEGGTFALIGATGVGKTTTAAKLAGLCARRHGPGSVGLISLDTYRVGAQEQLRAYGQMLGVVAHLAHDRAALQDLLGLLAGKKMVLIDTTGLAPRDPRKREMLELLDLPNVKRLLVLNAGGHGDTLDDTVTSFKSASAQQVIFSKIDEAVKLGPAIDAAIRHQLVVRGVTTGQRVPEDWEAASASKLVRGSLRATGNSAYDPKASDLGFIFNQSSATNLTAGHLHA
ncbi:flagellar biosynthesis protein FlhF [Rhodoferax saidenbachensis]|uniref:Flagellar biosynthesis protein FlhF n=1 Tax=Rhodoferax saidenbachensis TaxID=1484693 RepID=A0A1P8K6G5_9BURK|nr:flagellar biosynthesis protein FlhF [Rhodoferax saidenbachensis]APW41579.1 flagellar biosynthesis protein FlhF [Rhodoferax saidenbachensis]